MAAQSYLSAPLAPRVELDGPRYTASTPRINALKVTKELRAQRVDAAARDFEAVFLSQMMERMFETVPVSEEMGGGFAEETYRSLLMNEYGKIMANAGGIGLADHVKTELLKLQDIGPGGLYGITHDDHSY